MGIEEFLLQRAEEQGMRKAIEEMKTKFVENLLKLTNFGNERIASLVEADVVSVEIIRATLPTN